MSKSVCHCGAQTQQTPGLAGLIEVDAVLVAPHAPVFEVTLATFTICY